MSEVGVGVDTGSLVAALSDLKWQAKNQEQAKWSDCRLFIVEKLLSFTFENLNFN